MLQMMADGTEHASEIVVNQFGGYYLVNASSLMDQDGAVIGCVYIARDITSTQRAAREKTRNEERMWSLMKEAEYVVTVQTKDGEYLFLSTIPGMAPILEGVQGKTPFDFFEPETACRMVERVKRAVIEKGDHMLPNDLVWREERLHFLDHISPMTDAEGRINAVVTISRKIHEGSLVPGESANDEARFACDPNSSEEKFQELTKRECEILQLITAGLTNSQIAERLFISKKTVETHRARIMRKLDIHKTSSLVKFAMKQGLI
jgi:DNA-binding CsgD family transcriptional regulator